MNKSQVLSGSRDVTRAAPPPTILHHSTPLTHTTPDDAYSFLEVNRSQRCPRRGHGSGNEPVLNNTVPRTIELQTHVYQQRAAVWQQHSPLSNNAVRRSNNEDRQRDVSGVQDNAMAFPRPVVHPGGLAEQRHGRSPPAVGLNTGPTSSQVYHWVTPGHSDSAQRAPRAKTVDEKRERQQLKEKGGACLRCFKERKVCDRKDICWKCRLPRSGANPTGEATLCLRGIEKLWLWRAVEQPSLDPSSRNRALDEARKTTFVDSSQRLRDLFRMRQALPGNNMTLVVSLTSKLGDSRATSRIVMKSGSLTENLELRPDNLTKQFREALAAHIPDLVLLSLPCVLTADERSLVASAQSAFRVYNFFSNAAHVKYHASPRDMESALEVSCFLMEYCAILLATEVEEVLTKVNVIIRQKTPSDVLQHAIGLYYCILVGLKQWNTQNALDAVLNPLISRASVIIPYLSLLYRDTYETPETLEGFVNREIPLMTDIHNLHLSHELLSAIHNPPKPWDPTPDPFHKDCLVRDFLLPGRVGWIPDFHPVQRGVSSPRRIDAADAMTLQKARYEGSEPLYESPDATLLNSSSDDRSTFIQSPTEAEHGAELGHLERGQDGDVKYPEDLVGITGETGAHLKRGRSPASTQCTSPSPSPKRCELDAGQVCLGHPEHHFDDAALMMEASAASEPSSWDPLWERFSD